MTGGGESFLLLAVFVVLLVIEGLYCLILSLNLLRVLLGLELLTKGVTLAIAAAGFASGRIAAVQPLIITVIIIETVVVAVASGFIVAIARRHDSLSVRLTRKLKG